MIRESKRSGRSSPLAFSPKPQIQRFWRKGKWRLTQSSKKLLISKWTCTYEIRATIPHTLNLSEFFSILLRPPQLLIHHGEELLQLIYLRRRLANSTPRRVLFGKKYSQPDRDNDVSIKTFTFFAFLCSPTGHSVPDVTTFTHKKKTCGTFFPFSFHHKLPALEGPSRERGVYEFLFLLLFYPLSILAANFFIT